MKYSLTLLALGAGIILSLPLAPIPALGTDLIQEKPQEYTQLNKGGKRYNYRGNRGTSSRSAGRSAGSRRK